MLIMNVEKETGRYGTRGYDSSESSESEQANKHTRRIPFANKPTKRWNVLMICCSFLVHWFVDSFMHLS